MIYTLTCNPALDWMMRLDSFEEGKTNRAQADALILGGKGINVSQMLQNLEVPTCAWGFMGGTTGEALYSLVAARSIPSQFIHVAQGVTRINVKLKRMQTDACMCETEINGCGPKITEEDLARLKEQMSSLSKEDTLVLSGSLAPGCPATLYRDLGEQAASLGAKVVVDATGNVLEEALEAHPFLIKPNHEELADLFDISKNNAHALHNAAVSLAKKTEGFVLVSCGKEGAFLAEKNGILASSQAPQGTLVNAVGAGDSMVGGFIAGYVSSEDPLEALALATAAGSATAFSEGIASKEAVLKLKDHVTIKVEY